MTPFPLIHIDGSPGRRGRMYGEAACAAIHRSLTFYTESIIPAAGLSWGKLCDDVMERVPRWREAEPDLIEEAEGIAAGAGLEFADVLALNTRGTFVQTDGKQGEAEPEEGCTSFAVLPEASRDGHMRTGQNWDYLKGIRESIVLVHITPEVGPRMLMMVEAGQLGRHGANENGVALHANGLTSRLRDYNGLPSTFWRRQILREPIFTKALAAATKTPRVGSTNLVISHRDGFAVDLETRPHTTRWLHPEGGWLAHTNHFLSEIPPEIADTYDPGADSIVRYGRIEQLMNQYASGGGITFDDLATILKDHRFADVDGICTHARPDDAPEDAWESVASVITDLTTGVMAVSSGPPCKGSYVNIEIASGNVIGPVQSNTLA